MRWAELVLDYLRALVWPAVVLFIVLRFRSQLGDLVGRLRNADALGVSVGFDGPVTKAASALATAVPSPEPSRSPAGPSGDGRSKQQDADEGALPDQVENGSRSSVTSTASSFDEEALDRLLALAVNDRSQALKQAWELLIRTINQVDDDLNITKPDMLGIKQRNYAGTVKELERLGFIGPEVDSALRELVAAYENSEGFYFYFTRDGNQAISLAAATTFITTAYRLADTITNGVRKRV